MDDILLLKVQTDEETIEYGCTPVVEDGRAGKSEAAHQNDIWEIDEQLASLETTIEKENAKLERLTSRTDKADLIVAAACGAVTGLIDAFFVGELDLKEANQWGGVQVEALIKKVAGEKRLDKAIKKLEDKTRDFFPSDTNLNDFGGGRQHHLRDFAHHPTIVGLFFSILTQFTGHCYGTDVNGRFILPPVPVKKPECIGKTVPEKITIATVSWFLHLVSDMAGTHLTAGGGTGLPGPVLALAKELSVVPPFDKIAIDDVQVSVFISKIFNGTLFLDRDENGKIIKETVTKVDLRTELGAFKQQAMPVLINELLVRSFYSIRRMVNELKEHPIHSIADLKVIDWRRIVPFGNRTIVRMMTVADAAFSAIDLAAAAITGAVKSGGTAIGFAKTFILNINYVGLGRVCIAVSMDLKMGADRIRTENQIILLNSQRIALLDAKVFYMQEQLWVAAIETEETTIQLNRTVEEASAAVKNAIRFIDQGMEEAKPRLTLLAKENPEFAKELLDILEC